MTRVYDSADLIVRGSSSVAMGLEVAIPVERLADLKDGKATTDLAPDEVRDLRDGLADYLEAIGRDR